MEATVACREFGSALHCGAPWLAFAANMLDLMTLHEQLTAATDNLATTLADLLSEEARRLRAASAAHPIERQVAAAPPTPAAVPQKASAAPSPPKPLASRPNVHVVPSKPKAPVAAFSSTSLYEPVVHMQPPPEEIAKKAERLVWSASMPPTFERLRRSLRVTKAALEPVIEQLVADNKIRIVELGDVVLLEPPRIEPIRRRRVERTAATG